MTCDPLTGMSGMTQDFNALSIKYMVVVPKKRTIVIFFRFTGRLMGDSEHSSKETDRFTGWNNQRMSVDSLLSVADGDYNRILSFLPTQSATGTQCHSTCTPLTTEKGLRLYADATRKEG